MTRRIFLLLETYFQREHSLRISFATWWWWNVDFVRIHLVLRKRTQTMRSCSAAKYAFFIWFQSQMVKLVCTCGLTIKTIALHDDDKSKIIFYLWFMDPTMMMTSLELSLHPWLSPTLHRMFRWFSSFIQHFLHSQWNPINFFFARVNIFAHHKMLSWCRDGMFITFSLFRSNQGLLAST